MRKLRQSSCQPGGLEKLTAIDKCRGPFCIAVQSFLKANTILIWCHFGARKDILEVELAAINCLIVKTNLNVITESVEVGVIGVETV
jgi:hypothetical protein